MPLATTESESNGNLSTSIYENGIMAEMSETLSRC